MLNLKRLSALPCAALILSVASWPALAATPPSGAISGSSKTLTYSLDAQALANASGANGDYVCDATDPCDNFTLTVQLPADYAVTHPQDRIKIDATASPVAADIDMYLLDGAGHKMAESRHNPPTQESIIINAASGASSYIVRVFPGSPTAGGTVTITLFTDAGAVVPVAPGVFSGIAPRYQNFFPPDDSAINGSSGEFNIGFNPATGRIMVMNSGPIFRVTPPEVQTPALPESCDASWEDVSATITDTGLDPILWTDQPSGRTLASNLTAGAGALFAYSDDDGTNWIPASAAPPNAGSDHETIATGPYPAGSPFAAIAAAAGFNYAVYYCSQTYPVGSGACQRSDNGGASFENGVVMYDGSTSACGGIHGHAKVGPDGALYVPVRNCGGAAGYAISKDAGVTWNNAKVPNTAAGQWDPSIAIGYDRSAPADQNEYFCYGDSSGHAHALVSNDFGQTWLNDTDLGAAFGIENVAFEEAVAGDKNRASCGFVGTTTPGDYGALDFTGVWYLYIATTYDGGKTWVTVNATPGDPVQGAGGICYHGTFCSSTPNDRNLDDFNEVTTDDKGRVLFGYDDGCIGACVQDPTQNSFVAYARVARQIGGKPLLAAFDPIEPAKPNKACLAGKRTASKSHLTWKIPDNGGDTIASYKVFRSTNPDSFSAPLTTVPAASSYDDTTADPKVGDYYYKITAVNGHGESGASNVIKLDVQPEDVVVVETSCTLPGISVGTFPANDATDQQASHDITSMSVAEPADMEGKLAFTMKVSDLSTLPPNTLWAVRFHAPNPPAGGDVDYFAGMTSEGGAVKFVYGSVGVQSAQVTSAAIYTIQGNIDAASNYSAGGAIVLVADKTLFGGLHTGDPLGTITGTTRPFTNSSSPIAAGAQDTANGGSYRLVGTASCKTSSTQRPGVTAPASHFGGALGLTLLLPLLGFALKRRKRLA